jgi:hypothetical protein
VHPTPRWDQIQHETPQRSADHHRAQGPEDFEVALRKSREFQTRSRARFRDLVYVDTSKEVGDADHLKVFADQDAAQAGGVH